MSPENEILTMEWNPNAFEQAAATGLPVIFRHVPLNWKASNWSWSHLVKNIGHLNINVEESRGKHFFYYDHGKSNLLDERAWRTPRIFDEMEKYARVSRRMTFQEFVHRSSQPIVINARTNKQEEESTFHYFTRTVKHRARRRPGEQGEEEEDGGETADELDFRRYMLAQLQPTHPLPSFLTNDTRGSTMNIWMGGPQGTTTQAHYDESHNMFVQLMGIKTFTLAPPCAIDALYLYPDLHQRARKVQVPLENVRETGFVTSGMNFPLFLKHISTPTLSTLPQLQTVSVFPGDVLYLPPFWMHRVHVQSRGNVNAAASANIFIPSRISDLKEKMFSMSLPFKEEWIGSVEAPTAVHMWLVALTKRLSLSLRVLGERLVAVRYAHIRLESTHKYTWWDGMCRRQSSHPAHALGMQASPSDVPASLEKARMHQKVHRFAALALQIDRAVLWQIMQSYFELVVFSMMGGIKELKSFVRGCIRIL